MHSPGFRLLLVLVNPRSSSGIVLWKSRKKHQFSVLWMEKCNRINEQPLYIFWTYLPRFHPKRIKNKMSIITKMKSNAYRHSHKYYFLSSMFIFFHFFTLPPAFHILLFFSLLSLFEWLWVISAPTVIWIKLKKCFSVFTVLKM